MNNLEAIALSFVPFQFVCFFWKRILMFELKPPPEHMKSTASNKFSTNTEKLILVDNVFLQAEPHRA
jgi:hypothetical protein